jgi:hypothetical protein
MAQVRSSHGSSYGGTSLNLSTQVHANSCVAKSLPEIQRKEDKIRDIMYLQPGGIANVLLGKVFDSIFKR